MLSAWIRASETISGWKPVIAFSFFGVIFCIVCFFLLSTQRLEVKLPPPNQTRAYGDVEGLLGNLTLRKRRNGTCTYAPGLSLDEYNLLNDDNCVADPANLRIIAMLNITCPDGTFNNDAYINDQFNRTCKSVSTLTGINETVDCNETAGEESRCDRYTNGLCEEVTCKPPLNAVPGPVQFGSSSTHCWGSLYPQGDLQFQSCINFTDMDFPINGTEHTGTTKNVIMLPTNLPDGIYCPNPFQYAYNVKTKNGRLDGMSCGSFNFTSGSCGDLTGPASCPVLISRGVNGTFLLGEWYVTFNHQGIETNVTRSPLTIVYTNTTMNSTTLTGTCCAAEQADLYTAVNCTGGSVLCRIGRDTKGNVVLVQNGPTALITTDIHSGPDIAPSLYNTLALTNTGVTAGTYGNASTLAVPVITTNAQGRITGASQFTLALSSNPNQTLHIGTTNMIIITNLGNNTLQYSTYQRNDMQADIFFKSMHLGALLSETGRHALGIMGDMACNVNMPPPTINVYETSSDIPRLQMGIWNYNNSAKPFVAWNIFTDPCTGPNFIASTNNTAGFMMFDAYVNGELWLVSTAPTTLNGTTTIQQNLQRWRPDSVTIFQPLIVGSTGDSAFAYPGRAIQQGTTIAFNQPVLEFVSPSNSSAPQIQIANEANGETYFRSGVYRNQSGTLVCTSARSGVSWETTRAGSLGQTNIMHYTCGSGAGNPPTTTTLLNEVNRDFHGINSGTFVVKNIAHFGYANGIDFGTTTGMNTFGVHKYFTQGANIELYGLDPINNESNPQSQWYCLGEGQCSLSFDMARTLGPDVSYISTSNSYPGMALEKVVDRVVIRGSVLPDPTPIGSTVSTADFLAVSPLNLTVFEEYSFFTFNPHGFNRPTLIRMGSGDNPVNDPTQEFGVYYNNHAWQSFGVRFCPESPSQYCSTTAENEGYIWRYLSGVMTLHFTDSAGGVPNQGVNVNEIYRVTPFVFTFSNPVQVITTNAELSGFRTGSTVVSDWYLRSEGEGNSWLGFGNGYFGGGIVSGSADFDSYKWYHFEDYMFIQRLGAAPVGSTPIGFQNIAQFGIFGQRFYPPDSNTATLALGMRTPGTPHVLFDAYDDENGTVHRSASAIVPWTIGKGYQDELHLGFGDPGAADGTTSITPVARFIRSSDAFLQAQVRVDGSLNLGGPAVANLSLYSPGGVCASLPCTASTYAPMVQLMSLGTGNSRLSFNSYHRRDGTSSTWRYSASSVAAISFFMSSSSMGILAALPGTVNASINSFVTTAIIDATNGFQPQLPVFRFPGGGMGTNTPFVGERIIKSTAGPNGGTADEGPALADIVPVNVTQVFPNSIARIVYPCGGCSSFPPSGDGFHFTFKGERRGTTHIITIRNQDGDFKPTGSCACTGGRHLELPFASLTAFTAAGFQPPVDTLSIRVQGQIDGIGAAWVVKFGASGTISIGPGTASGEPLFTNSFSTYRFPQVVTLVYIN